MIDKRDNTDDKSSDLNFVPIFRRPFFSRIFPQYKKITSLSRFSEAGNSQGVFPQCTSDQYPRFRILDDSLVEDDDEKTGETGASIRATSVESEIDIIHLQSSHPKV